MRTLVPVLTAASLLLPATAQSYTTAPAGDGCGGASLVVTFTPTGNAGNSRFGVHAEGLHPHNPGLLILGVTPAAIGPVLDPGCFVRTEAIWAKPFMTDPSGRTTWERSWPASALGFYYVQLGSLDVATLEVRLTNCVLASHL